MESCSGLHSSSKIASDVISSNLLHYYHRPVEGIPQSEDLLTESDEGNYFTLWEIRDDAENKETIRFLNKSTQTDYRESDTQTDPWDPPFKVTKIYKEPEVLSLKQLTYGNGLPATMLELEYIAETRKNQKLLEELKEKGDLDKEKKKILCDQLKANWNYKAAVEAENQLNKIEVMQSSIVDELNRKSEKREQRLRKMWNQKKEEMHKKSLKLKEKLIKEKKNIDNQYLGKKHPRSLQSTVKIKEESKTMISNKETLTGLDDLLNTYLLSNPEGLVTIKNLLEKKQTVLKNEVPLPRPTRSSQREDLTEEAYQDILYKKRTKPPPKVYHEDYEKEEIILPAVKPAVEDITEYLNVDDQKIDMVTVWQQILRGLAYQKQMLQLIEKHKDGLAISLSEIISESNVEK